MLRYSLNFRKKNYDLQNSNLHPFRPFDHSPYIFRLQNEPIYMTININPIVENQSRRLPSIPEHLLRFSIHKDTVDVFIEDCKFSSVV